MATRIKYGIRLFCTWGYWKNAIIIKKRVLLLVSSLNGDRIARKQGIPICPNRTVLQRRACCRRLLTCCSCAWLTEAIVWSSGWKIISALVVAISTRSPCVVRSEHFFSAIIEAQCVLILFVLIYVEKKMFYLCWTKIRIVSSPDGVFLDQKHRRLSLQRLPPHKHLFVFWVPRTWYHPTLFRSLISALWSISSEKQCEQPVAIATTVPMIAILPVHGIRTFLSFTKLASSFDSSKLNMKLRGKRYQQWASTK